MTRLALEILNGNKDPSGINKTHIVLIPKWKQPSHATEFRPISLCNVMFQIITKIIANRLKLVLPELIDETQAVFVHDCQITGNAIVVFEAFHYMKN